MGMPCKCVPPPAAVHTPSRARRVSGVWHHCRQSGASVLMGSPPDLRASTASGIQPPGAGAGAAAWRASTGVMSAKRIQELETQAGPVDPNLPHGLFQDVLASASRRRPSQCLYKALKHTCRQGVACGEQDAGCRMNVECWLDVPRCAQVKGRVEAFKALAKGKGRGNPQQVRTEQPAACCWIGPEQCVGLTSACGGCTHPQVKERLAMLLASYNNSAAGRTATVHQRQRNMALVEALCGQLDQVGRSAARGARVQDMEPPCTAAV